MNEVPFGLRNYSFEKTIRVVRNPARQAEILAEDVAMNRIKSKFFDSAAGIGPPIMCNHETAWSSIFIDGDLDGGTVVFEIGGRDTGAFFPYPGPAVPGANVYGIGGVTAAGFFGMERLFGNNYGRFRWSGCGADADFFAIATAQMV